MALRLVNPVQGQLHLHLEFSAELVRRGIPMVEPGVLQGRKVVVTGSGPSLRKFQTIDKLRKLVKTGTIVFGCKESIRVLLDKGIPVHFSVSVDPTQGQASDAKTPLHPDIHYLVASSCHPALFRWLTGHKVSIFHSACGAWDKDRGETEADIYQKHFPSAHVMGGGFTVLNRAVMLAKFMGAGEIWLAGADFGSRQRDQHYFRGAVGKAGNTMGSPELTDGGRIDGKAWWTRDDMLKSAADLALGIKESQGTAQQINVIGDSLAASLARHNDSFIRAAAHMIADPGIQRQTEIVRQAVAAAFV